MKSDEILEFINRRFPANNGNWLNGNCFWFAKILSIRFPNGEIWYEPIIGHFLYKYENLFYDWNGIYSGNLTNAFKFDKEYDELVYNRLIRDCIL